MKTVLYGVMFVGLVALALARWPHDTADANRILATEGYTNVKLEGLSFWGCSSDDKFITKFEATKNDKPVSGVICGGWFKGNTVRTFN